MAYTIIRSNGDVLTTIQDGTINTGSTSVGLPGRNYAGYGQTLDTNFVRMIENFANDSVPANPLRGQLWYNTTDGSLRICPADNTNTASSWAVLNTASSGGNTTLGNVSVSGAIAGNTLGITYSITSDSITTSNATVSTNLIAANATITTANITTVVTNAITTTGATPTTTSGALVGRWSITGDTSNCGLYMNASNIKFSTATYGIKCDNYMYANGVAFTPSGTYGNSNVSTYLTAVGGFSGNISPTQVTTTRLVGSGTINGIWTLESGARIQATYSADLAERYAADASYPAGTVLEIGGDKEVTAVKDELSENVFGVVSMNAAYLMNSGAGEDATHPQVALVGRVPVIVVGKVHKGQRLVSAGDGKARGAGDGEATPFNSIGRALADKTDDGVGTVEAFVIVK